MALATADPAPAETAPASLIHFECGVFSGSGARSIMYVDADWCEQAAGNGPVSPVAHPGIARWAAPWTPRISVRVRRGAGAEASGALVDRLQLFFKR